MDKQEVLAIKDMFEHVDDNYVDLYLDIEKKYNGILKEAYQQENSIQFNVVINKLVIKAMNNNEIDEIINL